MHIEEIEEYLSKLNETMDSNIEKEIIAKKELAASIDDENNANYLWCLYQIFLVKKNYLDSFWSMKDKRYKDAWIQLDRADIELSFLDNHYEYFFNEPIGLRFQLHYILNMIKRFQMLFPYRLFTSRETIIKKEKCSICGETIKLRGGCKHRLGQLYNGEQCCHEVIDCEFVGIALVKDPFDKYAYLEMEGCEYNYEVIDFLMKHLNSPYELWNVKKLSKLKPNYEHIGRNSLCPCGSGKKYKKCCLGTTNIMMDHYIFDLPSNNGSNVKLSLI